jgi:CRP/FNR family transcriptional regulator, nitrogen fixation regulation protein
MRMDNVDGIAGAHSAGISGRLGPDQAQSKAPVSPCVDRVDRVDIASWLPRHMGTKLNFGRNQTIFNEGDDADRVYVLLSGVVRLCKHMGDGRRQIVQFLLPGDLFSFMDLAGHSLTAEAVNATVVLCYPQRQLAQLGAQNPALRARFDALMAERLRGLQDHLVLLGRQTAMERVCSFLLSLQQRTGVREGDVLAVPMSRQDLADYTGLTIETVCRVLTKLRHAGAIGLPNLHEILLKNVRMLATLAEGRSRS